MLLLAHVLVGLSLATAGPTATSPPAVAGALQQGKQLVGSPGSWTGTGTITFTYQWYRCDARGAHCSSIHGATRGTYREVGKDVGHTIGLTIRATDPTGTTAAYAPLAGLVAPAASPLVATRQPPLSGSAIVGDELKVEAGAWTGVPSSLAYGWWRCNANGRLCTKVADAAGGTYAPAAADVGHVVLATVTAGGRTVLSLHRGIVRALPGPVAAGRPTIAGVLRQGEKLTAAAGTFLGSGAISFAYRWYRCDSSGAHCSTIRGATARTLTTTSKDVGHTLALTVRATDSTGTTSAYSSLAGPIAASGALAATSQPTLTGQSAVGATITVDGGTWSSTPASLTYYWLRCNANVRLCTTIAGATGASYTATDADAGHTIVAGVSATAGTATQAVLTTGSGVVS